MDDYRLTLRRLALRDDRYIESLLADELHGGRAELDARTRAFATIAALAAMNAVPASYMSAVETALGNGATREEIVDALIAVLPVIGSSRVVSAAPNLALALGYDVDTALEEMNRDP